MASLIIWQTGETFLTADKPNELTWLENGQVVVNLKDGSVLSAKRVEGVIVFSPAPAGTQDGYTKAWPHPAGQKPPSCLSYWPDAGQNGQAIIYEP